MGEAADKNAPRKTDALAKLQDFLRTVGSKGSYRQLTLVVEEQDGVLQRNVLSLTIKGP